MITLAQPNTNKINTMNVTQLTAEIFNKKNYLCVGLDTDIKKLPAHFSQTKKSVIDFNKAIIDATKEHCVSYKINTAFYEAMGTEGWDIMQETVAYIGASHFIIADAKRGDIGNTSAQYAKTFFETYNFDAVTVAPYMGEDSVRPFLKYKDKTTIVLGLTSNIGAADFELQKLASGEYVYERVLQTVSQWGTENNLMFVVGATQAEELDRIRKIIPQHFLLVPGVGAQGGSLKEVSEFGMNDKVGLLVNVSRAVLYASSGEDFAEAAALSAQQYHEEMRLLMEG